MALSLLNMDIPPEGMNWANEHTDKQLIEQIGLSYQSLLNGEGSNTLNELSACVKVLNDRAIFAKIQQHLDQL